jgi:branched-chain amino acid transport system ATP-binding protein
MSLVETRGIDVFYGDMQALRGVTVSVQSGSLTSIVGANGAGKTTLVRALSGTIKPKAGEILFAGRALNELHPYDIAKLGLILVPEGRKLFGSMTLLENLELGGYLPEARKQKEKSLKWIFELFPILADRKSQLAGTLSGGEQQMCAIARGLMANPKMLMLDEPSLGLAPLMVKQTFEIVRKIREWNITTLLVEQNVFHALSMADEAYVIENGTIVHRGGGKGLLAEEHIKKAYLGI